MFFLLKKALNRILVLVGATTLISLAAIVSLVLWFFIRLPNVEVLKTCMTTTMYKVHLCDKDPDFAHLEAISPFAISAILVSEDASFFDHDGIDTAEIKESFIKNMHEGRFARGGSTITQQLAKNVFLNSEKSLLRKAEEIYLAFQLEKLFTKKRILTLYLNVVEFGPDIFGIKKAARYYFNKEPSEISPEEGAFLAFLLPNPKKYSQSHKQKQLTEFASKSIQTILHKMLISRKINDEEYRVAKQKASHLFGGRTSADLSESQLDQIIEQQQNTPSDSFEYESQPEEYHEL
jgi:monofunctional biosynthetic peptidoglycan transglycosylase